MDINLLIGKKFETRASVLAKRLPEGKGLAKSNLEDKFISRRYELTVVQSDIPDYMKLVANLYDGKEIPEEIYYISEDAFAQNNHKGHLREAAGVFA